jgi:hypothetical protein
LRTCALLRVTSRELQGCRALIVKLKQAIAVSLRLRVRRGASSFWLLRGVLHPNFSLKRTADRMPR